MSAWLQVSDGSAVGEARRRARRCAEEQGLPAHDQERAALVATESATNILRHARTGRILITDLNDTAGPSVALIATDRGPGIRTIDRMMEDGVSTAGSRGTGLGAMNRHSDMFEIFSPEGRGALIAAQIRASRSRHQPAAITIAALRIDHPGETVCGDAWAVRVADGTTDLIVCDGVGHGPEASKAAELAVNAFRTGSDRGPDALPRLSAALRQSRGAVALACTILHANNSLRAGGVGNVVGIVASADGAHGLPSQDGCLGSALPTLRNSSVAFGTKDTLILYSDGVHTIRDLSSYRGLLSRSPLTIAGVLLADHARGTDDACILVAKRVAAESATGHAQE